MYTTLLGRVVLLILSSTLYIKCTREEPLNPNLISPPLEITSPQTQDGGTLSTDTINFSFKGNDNTEYRFSFNHTENWSEFSTISNYQFSYLDDGHYTIKVEARNVGWENASKREFSFTVATMTSSSVYIFPQKLLINGTEAVPCEIRTAKLSPFDKIHIELQGCTLKSAVAGGLINDQKVTILKTDSKIDMILHPDAPPLLSDSLTILKLMVLPTSDTDSMPCSITCIVRDTLNNNIAIQKLRGAVFIRP